MPLTRWKKLPSQVNSVRAQAKDCNIRQSNANAVPQTRLVQEERAFHVFTWSRRWQRFGSEAKVPTPSEYASLDKTHTLMYI